MDRYTVRGQDEFFIRHKQTNCRRPELICIRASVDDSVRFFRKFCQLMVNERKLR